MQARSYASSPIRVVLFTVLSFTVILSTACGGGGSTTMSSVEQGSSPLSRSIVSHVAIVVLENANYNSVVNSPSMPYLNSLMAQGALATNYYANAHPSLPDYFMLTTGQTIATVDSFNGIVSDNNIVRELTNAGMSWKAYAQSIPSAGYLGPSVFPYYRHHVPFVFFSDVVDNTSQQMNVVPMTQLATDIANGMLPNYAMLVPDQQNNAHDCPKGMTTCLFTDKLAAADSWLKSNLPALLANRQFQQSGLLVITFDEAGGDSTNGGGKIVTVLVGTHVRPAYQGSLQYQHQSLLKLSLQALGLHSYPGAAATAPDMSEFFQ